MTQIPFFTYKAVTLTLISVTRFSCLQSKLTKIVMQGIAIIILSALSLHVQEIPIRSHGSAATGFQYISFDMDPFHRLTSHKISSSAVDSMEDCAMRCVMQWKRCFSFNLGNSTTNKQCCELISTDKYNSIANYSHSDNFHHFFKKVSIERKLWHHFLMVPKFLISTDNLSWRDGYLHWRTMAGKVWTTVLFLSANHQGRRKVIFVNFFVFFCNSDWAILLPWLRAVATSPLYSQAMNACEKEIN